MTERLQKRIRLAEAMGWAHIHRENFKGRTLGFPPAEYLQARSLSAGIARDLPDPWTSLDDCAACDAWIAEHKGVSYEPVLMRGTASPGLLFAVTGTPSRWDAYYMFDGEDRDVFFGRTLTEAWADAIYSVVVGDAEK